MKQYRYATYTPDGRICCASDFADHPLCERCRARKGTAAVRTVATAPVVKAPAAKKTPIAPKKTFDEWARHFAEMLVPGSTLMLDEEGKIIDGATGQPFDAKTMTAADFVPDPYAAPVAAQRAAEATPEQRAEDVYREQRREEFAVEKATRDAATPAPRLLTAAELKPYSAPNPYALPLARMKENNR